MRKTIGTFFILLFNFIHLIFFPEAFNASVKTIPLLYGAPSYKSGLHSIFDLRLAHSQYRIIFYGKKCKQNKAEKSKSVRGRRATFITDSYRKYWLSLTRDPGAAQCKGTTSPAGTLDRCCPSILHHPGLCTAYDSGNARNTAMLVRCMIRLCVHVHMHVYIKGHTRRLYARSVLCNVLLYARRVR